MHCFASVQWLSAVALVLLSIYFERLNGLPHAGFQIMSVFKPTVGRLFPLPVPIECLEILSVAIGAAVPQLSWKK